MRSSRTWSISSLIAWSWRRRCRWPDEVVEHRGELAHVDTTMSGRGSPQRPCRCPARSSAGPQAAPPRPRIDQAVSHYDFLRRSESMASPIVTPARDVKPPRNRAASGAHGPPFTSARQAALARQHRGAPHIPASLARQGGDVDPAVWAAERSTAWRAAAAARRARRLLIPRESHSNCCPQFRQTYS